MKEFFNLSDFFIYFCLQFNIFTMNKMLILRFICVLSFIIDDF